MNILLPSQLECSSQCKERLCGRMQQELKSFSFMQDEDLDAIAPLFKCRKVRAGTTLWREDDPSDYAVFIIAGRLELKKKTEFSDNQVVLGLLSRGAIAGEQALLDGQLREATAEASEDLDFIVLTRECFNRMVENFPHAAVNLLRCVLLATSTRLRRANDRLTVLF